MFQRLTLALILAAGLLAGQTASAAAPLSEADLVAMQKANLSDDAMVARIQEDGISFTPSPEVLGRLRDEGLDLMVVRRLANLKPTGAPVPEAPRTAALPPPPAAQEPVLVKKDSVDPKPVEAPGPSANPAAETRPAPTDPLFRSVVVNPNPFFHGANPLAAMGLVGALLASPGIKDESDRIAAYVKQEKIDVGAIVSNEFSQQFYGDRVLRQAFRKLPDARFTMEILYGITNVPFGRYRPYLSVRMKLFDAKGDQQWKDREYVGQGGKAESIKYEDYFTSPATFTRQLQAAASETTELLLEDLEKSLK